MKMQRMGDIQSPLEEIAPRVESATADLSPLKREIEISKEEYDSLRHREEQFRLAMEHAPIGKSILSMKGQWLYANPALCRFLGYSLEELLAMDFRDVVHPEDAAADLEQVMQLVAGERQSYSLEKRYIRSDGDIALGLVSVALVRNEANKPISFIAQVVDITERRKLEKLKKEFVATLTHELRTPVTTLVGALELIDSLSSETPFNELLGLLSIARSGGRRLRVLLDDILDFQMLSSDRNDCQITEVDVWQSAMDSVDQCREMVREFGVVVEMKSPRQTMQCRVDPNGLDQVLGNILSNAAKFSMPGSSVEVRLVGDERNVRIEIADQGIGIPQEYMEAVFQPFFQVAPSDTRDRQGSGLGLSICKLLVEKMRGQISIAPNSPCGTIVSVTLRR